MTHPAKFNKKFIGIFSDLLFGCKLILDPFAGTGRISELERYGFDTVGIEIEPEWATSIWGDSCTMPLKDKCVDAICTSPTYGNRMADSFTDHKPEKRYIRNTYHHHLGRKPSQNNTGRHHFGVKYLDLHYKIYLECQRVLKDNGKFILNTKNFVHSGVITDVTEAHIKILIGYGFKVIKSVNIKTGGVQYGSNRARCGFETITELRSQRGREPYGNVQSHLL